MNINFHKGWTIRYLGGGGQFQKKFEQSLQRRKKIVHNGSATKNIVQQAKKNACTARKDKKIPS